MPATAGNEDTPSGRAPAVFAYGLPVQQAAHPWHIEWSTAHDQARRKQVQDQSPPGGEPLGARQVADQQARIWTRPARAAPQAEADRLRRAADGQAEAQGLL